MGACSLIIKEPDGKKRVVPIERPTLSLGRSSDNDVVLTDSELRVSRRHAVIEWDPERGATLRDGGAVNGTFVNKQKVAAPVALHGGDVITITQENGRQTKNLRMALLILNYGHNNEIYGSIVTSMRIKSIVPPASEPRPRPQTKQ